MLDIKKINKLEFYDIGVFILLIKTVLSHSDLIPIDNWLDDVLSIVSVLFLFLSCLKKKYPFNKASQV